MKTRISLVVLAVLFLGLGVCLTFKSASSNLSVATAQNADAKMPVSQSQSLPSPDNLSPTLMPTTATGSKSVPLIAKIMTGSVSPVRADRPVSVLNNHKVEYSGLYGEARIAVAGKSYDLSPNQMGNFQRVYINTSAKVAIQINYPEGQAGDPVAVEVEDGGELANKTMGEVVQLDDQKDAQIQFVAGDQEGIYRLVLRYGADVKTINLWVGQDTASN